MSCALLFDLEKGELAPPEDEGDSGARSNDASSDGVPPKGDAAVPDGSDVRLDTALDVAPTDGVANDTIGDVV